MRAGEELAQEHFASAVAARQIALQNLQKRVDSRARMSDWAEGPMARDNTPRPDKALQGAVSGTTDPRAVGGRFGTEGKWIAQSKDYAAGIQNELKQAGLEGVARSGALDAQVWKEMYALSPAGKLAGEKPGWSGSPEAAKIAATYQKYYALARERLNEQGALTGELSDFVQHNSHDPIKLEKAGFEAWRDATLPRLDQARTFEAATAEGTSVNDFMRSVWNALATGVHLSDAGSVGFKDPAFSGPANLAEKLSQQRLLHWKDAQSGFEYFKQFGMNGTMGEMLATLPVWIRTRALPSTSTASARGNGTRCGLWPIPTKTAGAVCCSIRAPPCAPRWRRLSERGWRSSWQPTCPIPPTARRSRLASPIVIVGCSVWGSAAHGPARRKASWRGFLCSSRIGRLRWRGRPSMPSSGLADRSRPRSPARFS